MKSLRFVPGEAGFWFRLAQNLAPVVSRWLENAIPQDTEDRIRRR